MRPVVPVLDVTVAVSTAAALLVVPRVRERRPSRFGPEPVLAVVVGLILLNQLLFAVYVQRAHHGDTSFISRYFLPGWFDVPRHNAVVDWLAQHLPGPPTLLSPSLLRVQAFLELPLVLLTFAAVLRRLDTGAYLRAVRSPLVPLASVSYTVAFCAVEWDLHNPYTADDLALRALSALVTPVLLSRTAKPLPVPRGPIRFTLDLWAFGTLMLALYDTALLYNSARLADHLPAAALALAVLTATRLTPARPTGTPGPRSTALTALLARALTLFLVPALAIRYGVSFAHPRLAAAAALLVLAAAALRREVLRLAVPAAAGAAAGCAVAVLAPGPYFEATALRAATCALLATSLLCTLLDGGRGAAGFRKSR